MEIKQKMVDNGAVIFREFDLMKSQEGFVKFYEALGMKTCLDPLHSVSARPTVDGNKNSPVYEAVNKESRKNFFIGEMHCYFFQIYLTSCAVLFARYITMHPLVLIIPDRSSGGPLQFCV